MFVGTLFAGTPLTLRVLSESAPAGGWAQIKIVSDTPVRISRGVLQLDLDPTIFGPIAGVAAFSATGDAIGWAVVDSTHLSVSLSRIIVNSLLL